MFLYLLKCFFCARASVFNFCMFGCLLVGPAEPRDATPIVQSRHARKSNTQSQTNQRRTTTQKRNPVDFSFLRPNLAHRWAAHNMFPLRYKTEFAVIPIFTKVNPRPLQLEGSAKPSNPCSPCTFQKGFHMTNQPNARYKSYNRTKTQGFRCSVYIKIMVWLKKYRDKKRAIGKPEASQC